MPGVREKLTAWLDKTAALPFQWGENDCCLDAADWLDQACGLSIADEWRGRYASEAEADTLIADYGGLQAMTAEIAAQHGLSVTDSPMAGDVAVLSVASQGKPLVGILMPSLRWRMRTMQGIVLTKAATVEIAWSLPCRPKPPGA